MCISHYKTTDRFIFKNLAQVQTMRSPSPKLRCGRGKMVRRAYTTKRGTRVPATCIRDLGRKGHGSPILPKLRKGSLTALGYQVKDAEATRRKALRKAVAKGVPVDTLIWKLVAQANLRKNFPARSPQAQLGKRFKADQEFLSRLY